MFITALLHGKPCSAAFDTGASPSVITAKYLQERDSNSEARLQTHAGLETRGFGGKCAVLGIYSCAIVFPHAIGSLSTDIEFLVLSDSPVPYQMIIGRDTQVIYAMNLVTPADPSKDSYVQIGKHPQRYVVLDGSRPGLSTLSEVLQVSEAGDRRCRHRKQ